MPTLPDSAKDEVQILVELYPWDSTAAGGAGAVTPFFLATTDYVTGPADTPAHTAYDGALDPAISVAIDIGAGGPAGGHTDAARGVIAVENPADQANGTGRYSKWRRLSWQMRRVVILVGKRDAARSTFVTVLDGVVRNVAFPAGDKIEISVANTLDRLNQAGARNQYGGTGGADGDVNMAGKWKPTWLGLRREIEAPLVNPALGIFQLHDGKMHSVLACNQKGAAVTYDGNDYATYALLAAATVALGHYATAKAVGFARCGSDIVNAGPVTWDGEGDDDAGYTPAFASKTADIAVRLMQKYGGLAAGATAGTYSASSAAALATLQGAAAGHFIGTDRVNLLTELDTLMRGAGCWYSDDVDGVVIMGRLDAPTIAGPTDVNCKLVITDDDMPYQGLVMRPRVDPAGGVVLGYKRFGTVQNSGYATGLTNARVAELAQEFRHVSAATLAATAAAVPGAALVPLIRDSAFDDVTVATNETTRLNNALGVQRDTFDIQTFLQILTLPLGSQVWVTSGDYDLGAGQGFVLIGKGVTFGDNRTKAVIWG